MEAFHGRDSIPMSDGPRGCCSLIALMAEEQSTSHMAVKHFLAQYTTTPDLGELGSPR